MPGFGVNTDPSSLRFCLPAHQPCRGGAAPQFLEKVELDSLPRQEAWQSRTLDIEHMSHDQASFRGPDPESAFCDSVTSSEKGTL